MFTKDLLYNKEVLNENKTWCSGVKYGRFCQGYTRIECFLIWFGNLKKGFVPSWNIALLKFFRKGYTVSDP